MGLGRRAAGSRAIRPLVTPSCVSLGEDLVTGMREVAVVTGGSRGIGAAISRLLASRGFAVCVNYATRAEAADRLVEELKAAGGEAIAVQADVGYRADVERLFAAVDAQLGVVNALVNNAAIMGPVCRAQDLPDHELERVLRTNIHSAFLCSQQAVKRMSTAAGGRGGSIVNVSSGTASGGSPGRSLHYAMSKAAINTLTTGLAQELGGVGIRVNAVSPGMTADGMLGTGALAEAPNLVPMGRPAEPSEVAQAVCWLLSPLASYVSGANLRVSGGRP